MNEKLQGLILLPHLKVENVNAISGPFTWGFPSPTAFAGFVHALNRKLGDDKIRLEGAGIVCHRFVPQVYKTFNIKFCLTRNPVDEHGKPPTIVEEGRAHMEVSLLMGHYGEYLDDPDELLDKVSNLANGMRLAGGSVRPDTRSSPHKVEYIEMGESLEKERKDFRKLRRKLLPGFVLINRHDLLRQHLEDMQEEKPEVTALDALLDIVALKHAPEEGATEEDTNVKWHTYREKQGWLVPLPIGYGAISELYPPGSVANSRDKETPFRFVESLCGLGEWKNPLKLEHPSQMLWHHKADPEAGLYIVDHKNNLSMEKNNGC